MEENTQITTIAIFRFSAGKFWAFKQMRQAVGPLSDVAGLSFFKVLGCGAGNGFSIFPDFGTYALLQIWENEEAADHYFQTNVLHADYVNKSHQHQVIYMHATDGHGKWEGINPFRYKKTQDDGKPIAVLTRATIHARKLLNFWKYVPNVSRSMEGAPGLRFALGIGELPLIQQATISLWDSRQDMMNYAYTMKRHKEVVTQTRKQNWYKEELFTRFKPYRSEGDIEELKLSAN
ncbi:MAG: spheroidene monooxygenase [Cyclobacteriaceae bacterium]